MQCRFHRPSTTLGRQNHFQNRQPANRPASSARAGKPGKNSTCVSGETCSDAQRFHRPAAIRSASTAAARPGSTRHRFLQVKRQTAYWITAPNRNGSKTNPARMIGIASSFSPAPGGGAHTSVPAWMWKVFPSRRRPSPISSQQVIKTWPLVIRPSTNACRRGSSSESTSSSSSTGHSPVS